MPCCRRDTGGSGSVGKEAAEVAAVGLLQAPVAGAIGIIVALFQSFQGLGEALMSQYIRRHLLGEPFHPFRIQIRKVIVRRPGVGIFMGGRFIHQFRNKPEEKKGHPRGVPLREDMHGGENLILLPQSVTPAAAVRDTHFQITPNYSRQSEIQGGADGIAEKWVSLCCAVGKEAAEVAAVGLLQAPVAGAIGIIVALFQSF